MDPLTDVRQLKADLAGGHRPVLVDVRWTLGAGPEANRADYLRGHLPGAAFLDLESGLSDPVRADRVGGRHPLPSRDRVQTALRAAGVRHGTPVVFYDAGPGLGAARAWWVAEHYGFTRARVLDGGLAAWQRAGGPVQQGEPVVLPGDVVLGEGGPGLLDAADLARWSEQGGQVVDARPAPRYRGEQEPMDPVAGHVPGARNVPASSLAPDGAFLPAGPMRDLVRSAGVDPDRPAALYCGSGVQAAHLALALRSRGLAAGTTPVYVGSWSDWVSDPTRPVATGAEPGAAVSG